MAKKNPNKAEGRWRKEREERRVLNAQEKKLESHQELIDILSNKDKRVSITLFTDDEKKEYFAKPQAIGTIQCPLCAKPKVLVANENGCQGKPEDDYIMRHNGTRHVMCDASLMLVQKLLKEKS